MFKNQDSIKDSIERDLNILSQTDNYTALQYELIDKYIKKRILEIGAGIGNHTDQFIEKKPELLIILEKEKSFCKSLKNKYGQKVEILNIDLIYINDYIEKLKRKGIDTIIAINVLEHIKEDILCLEKLSEILVQNGRILLIVPAFKCLYSNLDSVYGHYRRYTKKMIKNYSQLLNLELIENSYFNLLGWFSWLIFAKIGKINQMSKNGMLIIDKIIPLQKFIEKYIKFPVGLSLLTVLEKK